MNKRRKLKNKRRRSLPRPHDFFDAQTLDAIRHRAICFNLSAHIESLGKGHSVVFHSTVIAKRKEDSGKIKLLLHWMPEDILPDVWVNESERHQLKTKFRAAPCPCSTLGVQAASACPSASLPPTPCGFSWCLCFFHCLFPAVCFPLPWVRSRLLFLCRILVSSPLQPPILCRWGVGL